MAPIYPMNQVNVELYRIFLHTARLGNLTKAAQQLHITQPSVSYAIKQLESRLEVKLFDRLSKGVQLTPEGSALLEYVEQSFALLQAGEQKIANLKKLSSGELRVGASGPMFKHLLLPALDHFHVRYPDVRIRLSQAKSSDIQHQLIEGQIDIGLVHLPLNDERLASNHLISQQQIFVVGSAYRHFSKKKISANELNNIPLLLFSKDSSTRDFVEKWLLSLGIEAQVDIELGSLDLLIEFAKRGYGAAFVARAFAEQELQDGTLFELQIIESIPLRSISVATRRDMSLSISAQQFMEVLIDSLKSSI
ncbi:LysR family transcriptional regulator [Paenibacillus lentus]|uniref:LysR family transcriptional regulator n=1 Tax=Paenibacillus lentus TaxID=1338368 RepID=A0A3S8RXP8_9BACL|nr:LysR family transcriptional regulator [Paenibacillus lentus]AZK47620.1 LysR family transcriptional regulator [Paenibacillus lentus]